MVSERTFGHMDIYTGAGRRTDRWLLQITGYTFDLFVYSSHLKAGPTFGDDRLTGVEAIRSDADSLPAGSKIIYVGDFNFYSNNESGYLEMLLPGNGQAVDPLGSTSWSGAANAWKHTQSPRLSNSGSLVGGGMDDRFDQHLTTAGLQDGSGLTIHNYRALGNDGNHYNTSINAGNNNYYIGQTSRSNALADDLFDASDHIPVVVDYQLPARVSTYVQDDQGIVIEGAMVTVDVLVANAAAGGRVDSCPVFIEGSSGIYGDDTIFDAPRLPSFDTVNLLLDTTTVGDIIGTVRVVPLGEDMNATYEVSTVAVVIGHARPSFSGGVLQPSTEITLDYAATDGVSELTVPLHNFGYDPLQAGMLYVTTDGLPAGITVTGAPIGAITSSPKDLELTIDPAAFGVGTHDVQAQVQLFDQNLPGAIGHVLDLGLEIIIEDDDSRPGDLNGDGVVDGTDLALILGAWSTSAYDLDGDGIVSGSDLAIILGDWGG